MRLRFVQSGGFVGAIRACTLDTTTLSKDDANSLKELVRNADLSTARPTLSVSGRDLEQYEISVEENGASVTVTYDQSTLSAGMKPLVAYLKKRAKSGMPG